MTKQVGRHEAYERMGAVERELFDSVQPGTPVMTKRWRARGVWFVVPCEFLPQPNGAVLRFGMWMGTN